MYKPTQQHHQSQHNKYPQKQKNDDHSHQWLNNIQISPQDDHQQKYNPNIHN